jgi:hypothetical protein
MAWRAKRGHQHQIESQVEPSEIGAREQESLGGARDAPPLPRGERHGGGGDLAARLHLDHRQHLAASRHNIVLAGRAAPIPCDDAPAMQSQMPVAEAFRKTPATSRTLAAQRGGMLHLSHALLSRIASARR